MREVPGKGLVPILIVTSDSASYSPRALDLGGSWECQLAASTPLQPRRPLVGKAMGLVTAFEVEEALPSWRKKQKKWAKRASSQMGKFVNLDMKHVPPTQTDHKIDSGGPN